MHDFVHEAANSIKQSSGNQKTDDLLRAEGRRGQIDASTGVTNTHADQKIGPINPRPRLEKVSDHASALRQCCFIRLCVLAHVLAPSDPTRCTHSPFRSARRPLKTSESFDVSLNDFNGCA